MVPHDRMADRWSNQFYVSDEEQWVLGFINGLEYSAVAAIPVASLMPPEYLRGWTTTAPHI
jgi:hypothetical protein